MARVTVRVLVSACRAGRGRGAPPWQGRAQAHSAAAGPRPPQSAGGGRSEPRRPWPPPAAEELGPRAPAAADDGDHTGRVAAAAAAAASQNAASKARRGGAAAVSRAVPVPAAAARGEREGRRESRGIAEPVRSPRCCPAGREAAARDWIGQRDAIDVLQQMRRGRAMTLKT
ncbi:uncharacterized protein LOC102162058 [Sus scrofa]|uniref:uncharacterized protein LOC102162058 n=1 Tax=Sus scrofa TaxID=9823 RepID=UPI000A2B4ECE|nr:uncharacterized protein LOC102162058 [Sus scrofa]